MTPADHLNHCINDVVNATIDLHDWAGGLKASARRGDFADVRRALELLQRRASGIESDIAYALEQLDKTVGGEDGAS